MILLNRFRVDENCYVDVVIPELPDKDNYYYQPAEKLHIFDIATAIYRDTDHGVILFEDAVELTMQLLKNNLQSALAGKQALPSHIILGTASLSFSIDTLNDNYDVEYNSLWLWSSVSRIQTWLYTREDKIYLEVSSSYPWLSVDPEPSDNYYSFEEYAATYHPIAIHEISKETAQQWIKQSDDLLKSMERPRK